MTPEQILLLARIINQLCVAIDIIEPYNSWGANIGRCRFCHAVGEYARGELTWTHAEECLISLNGLLQLSLTQEEK